jgi:hypothetical protein
MIDNDKIAFGRPVKCMRTKRHPAWMSLQKSRNTLGRVISLDQMDFLSF